MKNYQRLSMEVVKLNNEDVLTTSGGQAAPDYSKLCYSDKRVEDPDMCIWICGSAPNSKSCKDMFK